MFSFFDDDRRKINLGGATSAATHKSIIDQAKARRTEREDRRRRQENATKIQAWWRGRTEAKRARRQIRELFEQDVTSISGLRCIMLLGDDDAALDTWANELLRRGSDAVFDEAKESGHVSWLVLIRQVAVLALKSISRRSSSQSVLPLTRVLDTLLSTAAASRILGNNGIPALQDIVQYLLRHDFHPTLSAAVCNVIQLPGSKSSPTVPLMISISTSPFSIFPSISPNFAESLVSFMSCIASIPQLLSKIPLSSLTMLSSRLPFPSLHVIIPHISSILDVPLENRINLVANLYTLTQPRYGKLSASCLDAYLLLLSSLLNTTPAEALNPPKTASQATDSSHASGDDIDSDDEYPTKVVDVSNGALAPPVLPVLEPKTLKKLQTLPDIANITSLLSATSNHTKTRLSFVTFLLALCFIFPTRKDKLLTSVLVHTGGGLVRELYRGYVRTSQLGKDDNFNVLCDPANASNWPPLLFLAELYAQALLTMGDDEFFGTSPTSTATHRNPLTLDELGTYSKQLLNIAFTLFLREDQTNVQQSGIPDSGLHYTWESIRQVVTRCLLGIHARDSRKRFTSKDHWLVSSKLDMQSFVEAAIYDEQRLSAPTNIRSGLTKRQIAHLSPRLGVLNNIPFAIPFETRVAIFRHFIANDMLQISQDNGSSSLHPLAELMRPSRRSGTHVYVHRGSVAQDGFDKLFDVDLKENVRITFIDQFGNEEAGIDGGGVFKEFFTSLCQEVFDTDRGLWLATKQNELYPNPHAYATEPHSLNWYRFIGRILGKAMYEGILVDVAFAGFFLAKWLKKQSFLDDLVSLDPDLYAGLVYLKHYTGDPEDLSLNFTVAIEEFGVTKTIDLIPNGSNIAVTRENRLQYIHLISHYRLSKQIKLQSEAFFEGLSEMIDHKWLRMFNQQEVQILLSGTNSPIDLVDLQKHTMYGGVYDAEHATIETFWKVVNSFNQEQRMALLRFVTSCSRPPLLGFKELVPNFAIRDSGRDEHRLPTSSTCVNLLKLPLYQSEGVLRSKLLQAITSGAGFDLS